MGRDSRIDSPWIFRLVPNVGGSTTMQGWVKDIPRISRRDAPSWKEWAHHDILLVNDSLLWNLFQCKQCLRGPKYFVGSIPPIAVTYLIYPSCLPEGPPPLLPDQFFPAQNKKKSQVYSLFALMCLCRMLADCGNFVQVQNMIVYLSSVMEKQPCIMLNYR